MAAVLKRTWPEAPFARILERMKGSASTCAVCGAVMEDGNGMPRVIIEGRALSLCLDHAATVAIAMPTTFEEMRELFVQSSVSEELSSGASFSERRSPIDRRASDDRRVFPPRAEGRRMTFGRRSSDPAD